jgi:hypothetical protein
VIKDEEILAVYNQGPDAVITLVKGMLKSFELQVAILDARIKHLENQINTTVESLLPATVLQEPRVRERRAAKKRRSKRASRPHHGDGPHP